jgi:hypothetical protein
MSGAGWGGETRSKRTHSPTFAKASIVKVPALGPNAKTVAGILRLEQFVPVHVELESSKMLWPEASEAPDINRTAAPTTANN